MIKQASSHGKDKLSKSKFSVSQLSMTEKVISELMPPVPYLTIHDTISCAYPSAAFFFGLPLSELWPLSILFLIFLLEFCSITNTFKNIFNVSKVKSGTVLMMPLCLKPLRWNLFILLRPQSQTGNIVNLSHTYLCCHRGLLLPYPLLNASPEIHTFHHSLTPFSHLSTNLQV